MLTRELENGKFFYIYMIQINYKKSLGDEKKM